MGSLSSIIKIRGGEGLCALCLLCVLCEKKMGGGWWQISLDKVNRLNTIQKSKMLPEDYLKTDINKPIEIGEMKILPVWFDSMGAKSMCTYVQTPDINILIDPAAAIMQPSYPLKENEKEAFLIKALDRVREYSKKADIIIITHYHYDHHKVPSELPEAYIDKQLYIKDPNKWINFSQWERVRLLYGELLSILDKDLKMKDLEREPEETDFKDPFTELTILQKKDFGDYKRRHSELIGKWKHKMLETSKIWKTRKWLTEFSAKETSINFIKEGVVNVGETRIVFQKPFFHGIEYAKTGWVEPVVISHNNNKFLFSSDLQGPTIEDYAQWIISEDPDVIILDGPATYLFGYMLNRVNLNRSIENASRIVRECNFEIMIYDHHCLRERRFRERLKPFYETVKESKKNVLTAAEWFKLKPLAEII